MAGSIGRVLLFFACLGTEKESRSGKLARKEQGQYPAILSKQVNIGFVMSKKKPIFSFGTQRVISSGQDRAILPIE